MNDLVTIEIEHGKQKYGDIDIFTKLKEMIQYLEQEENVEIKNGDSGNIYRAKWIKMFRVSEPYIKKKKYLKGIITTETPTTDKELLAKVYFSSTTTHDSVESRIDELIVFDLWDMTELKPLSVIVGRFADHFGVKTKIKY
jgi:hypothetical protein